MNDLSILTVNFNTPEFIFTLNKSLRKRFPEFTNKLIVVDNGNVKLPEGNLTEMIVHYFDNELYKVLDELPLSKFPAAGNYNSAHHALTIDWAIKNLVKTKYLLLLDSDILFKENPLKYYEMIKNANAALLGFKRTTYKVPCIAPWCCFIDVEKMKKHNFSFFDFNRILYVNDNLTHDTGASLYEDFINAGEKIIEIPDNLYYLHFKGGSVFNDKCKQWIIKNENLWK